MDDERNDLEARLRRATAKVLQSDTARNLLTDARVRRAMSMAVDAGRQVSREAAIFGRELARAAEALRGPGTVSDDLADLKAQLDRLRNRRQGDER
jgi:hypothetical protein